MQDQIAQQFEAVSSGEDAQADRDDLNTDADLAPIPGPAGFSTTTTTPASTPLWWQEVLFFLFLETVILEVILFIQVVFGFVEEVVVGEDELPLALRLVGGVPVSWQAVSHSGLICRILPLSFDSASFSVEQES